MSVTTRINCFSASFVLGLVLYVVLSASPAMATTSGLSTFFPFEEEKGSTTSSSGSRAEWYALDERLNDIDRASQEPDTDAAQLRLWLREIGEVRNSVASYVALLEAQQSKLANDLAALGESVANEPEAVTSQRKTFVQERGGLEGKLAGYRLLLLHIDELLEKLGRQRQQLLTQHFFARGPSVLALLQESGAQGWQGVLGGGLFLVEHSGIQLFRTGDVTAVAGFFLAALLVGLVFRQRVRRWCERQRQGEYRYSTRMLAALGHYAPYLLPAILLAMFMAISFREPPFPAVFLLGVTLPLFFLLWVLLHFLFRLEGGNLPLFVATRFAGPGLERSLKLLALLAYGGYLTVASGLVTQMPETGRFLLSDLLVSAMSITLWWSAVCLRRILQQHQVRGIHGIVLLLLLTTIAAQLLGYRNLSYWILRTMLGTVSVIGIAMLCSRLITDFFSGLQSGTLWWQRSFRQLLGYGDGELIPWLGWFRILLGIGLWLACGYGVLFIWGLSTDTMRRLYDYFFDGFPLGSLTVVPARIVLAMVVFALLLVLSGWMRRMLDERWLRQSRMERGSREALVTIVGYVGVALAILIALSVAGVQFTNLAIIAGALSVGIGFGLQNIVNNFVSGLILLFERPVKTGDWIMVGNTEGYVKRIRIRSTLIQTFDRADVIVPNSELISGQVTNWMLYDQRGRIKVPIGVAYGSDTRQVHDLLLEIAAAHPKVITDGSVSVPKALFIGFGDSALNFELRAFVQNIDERLQIVSDINFAIDAAFREHGIEIPFPQRDLHVRNWPYPPPTSPERS